LSGQYREFRAIKKDRRWFQISSSTLCGLLNSIKVRASVLPEMRNILFQCNTQAQPNKHHRCWLPSAPQPVVETTSGGLASLPPKSLQPADATVSKVVAMWSAQGKYQRISAPSPHDLLSSS